MQLLATLVALTLAIQASATIVIYDAGTPGVLTQFSDKDASGRSIGGQFTLGETTTLQFLEWWGAYAFANTPLAADSFSVRIYAVTSGVPESAPLIDFALTSSRVLSGLMTSNNLPIYRYTSTMPDAMLGPGTYVLSIVNDTRTDTNDNWYWSQSTATNLPAWERNTPTSAWYNLKAGDPPTPTPNVAFNVSGFIPTPEPGTLSLVAVAGLCFAGRRLRGRSARE
jgi:hypothetical protein